MLLLCLSLFFFFFFNDTATTEIYTLSLHDALPISLRREPITVADVLNSRPVVYPFNLLNICLVTDAGGRSEEHTSELQSLAYLVCRLLLEKKKKKLQQCPLCRIERSTSLRMLSRSI